MKKLTLSVAFLALSVFVNAQTTSEATLNPSSEQAASNIKVGTVVEVSEKGGKLVDNNNGEVLDFYHPGAQVDFKVGDAVSYVLITFPNGKPPVVIDIKRPQ